ncbi:MAG: hypothetical protein NZ480_05235, partial [Bdellovibrionaceae bacterium]|nr:hypothetical protein [Pseudobdellovibrionaceae bacterium]MDW8191084.1 hypothetical protein [Pseudobdellovibrionaceae bacterium]
MMMQQSHCEQLKTVKMNSQEYFQFLGATESDGSFWIPIHPISHQRNWITLHRVTTSSINAF